MKKYLLYVLLCLSLNASAQIGIEDFVCKVQKVYHSRIRQTGYDVRKFVDNATWYGEGIPDGAEVDYIPVFEMVMKKSRKNLSVCGDIPSERFDSLFLFLNPKSLALHRVLVLNDGKIVGEIDKRYENRREWPAMNVVGDPLYQTISSYLQSFNPDFCFCACQEDLFFLVKSGQIICLAKTFGPREYRQCSPLELKDIYRQLDCFDVNLLFRQTTHTPSVYVK